MDILGSEALFSKVVFDHLWGQLPPSPYLTVRLYLEREASQFGVLFYLAGTVSSHIGGLHAVVPDFRLGYQKVLTDLMLHHAEGDIVRSMGAFLRGFCAEACFALAPRLYESDPRIGLVFTVDSGFDFPSCPLLDVPGGVRRPTSAKPWTQSFPPIWSRCLSCKSDFRVGEPVMWGGGNLLWVCARCRPTISPMFESQ